MYQKILVPLDGSKLAEIALPHAESLATRYDAALVLLSVVDPPTTATHDETTAELVQYELDAKKQEAEIYLKGLKGEFEKKKIPTSYSVRFGSVVPEHRGQGDGRRRRPGHHCQSRSQRPAARVFRKCRSGRAEPHRAAADGHPAPRRLTKGGCP
jgi:hypothetical protein